MIMLDENLKSTRQLTTPAGLVTIEGPVDRSYLDALSIDPQLSNFRNPTRQKEALMIVASSPEGMVYIARHRQTIIGYVSFHYPSQYTRWSRHPRILELGAIEVSRSWQRRGIATALLEQAFENEIMEEYVVITTEFYWHWDLKGSGLDVWAYQKMLLKLYSKVGFKRRHTDDPEILQHPANMLMVRLGKKLDRAYIKAFEDLTYQQSLVD